MCLSPKTSRTNINSIFNSKNTNRNISKDDNNKLANKRLSSRNNENMKNSKKNIYKKIIPNYLIQFSSNNSTSSNTSNFNNVKTNNHIFNDYEKGNKNPNYIIKRNMKYFKKQDYSNVLINNTKEKVENIFQKYKKKTYNSQINKSNNNIKTRHNRSLSKNLNQDLVISKIVDKLAIDNINKINNFKVNKKHSKFDIEKTFFGSMTAKNHNPYLKTNSKNINFPISTNYKNIISINNINSLPISRHSALTSSTGKIYSKKISKQNNSNRPNRPNSNDNIKKYKNIRNKGSEEQKGKIMNLSKSKELYSNITFNNYCKKQKNYRNRVGLNNNKIEYVQINLFNNGIEDKIIKEKNFIFNKIEKKGISNGNSNVKKIKNNKEKDVKLFDNDINGSNGSNDGIYMTKSFLSLNDKSRITKDLFTPEENHFQAVNFVQIIKNNNKKFC